MLLCSLPEESSAACMAQGSFCSVIAAQLCSLYNKLPTEMDPSDINCVEAKWG